MELLSRPFLRRLHELRRRLEHLPVSLDAVFQSPSGKEFSPEVESHKEYSQGDELRYIDWSVYARFEKFFVKTMVREEEGAVYVLLDTSASMARPFAEKLSRGKEVAAALAFLALCGGRRVSVIPWSDRVLQRGELVEGERRAARLLKRLSQAPAGGKTDLGQTLAGLLRLGGISRSSVLLVSDFIDTGPYATAVEHLLLHGVRLGAIQILCREETAWAKKGDFLFEDPETGERVRGVMGYRAVRDIRRRIEEFLRSTEAFFAPRTVRFLRAEADSPFEDIVVRYFLPGRS